MEEQNVYMRNSGDKSETPADHLPVECEEPKIVAVSSQALFNLEGANAVWEDPEKTRQDYIDHVKAQAEDRDYIPKKGRGFDFVKALQNINTKLKKLNPKDEELFEVLIIHDCGASCGLVEKALKHYELNRIVKDVKSTDGKPPVDYLTGVTLFLTLNQTDVDAARKKGIAAQLIEDIQPTKDNKLRIAFESGCIMTSGGFANDRDPLYKVISAIARIQEKLQKHIKSTQEKLQNKKTTDLPLRMYIISRHGTQNLATLDALHSWKLQDIHEAILTTEDHVENVISVINPHLIFREKRACESQ